MPLENIDLDNDDLAAIPESEQSQLEAAIVRSIENNGINSWREHLAEARIACNDELSVQQLSRTLAKVIEEVI